MLETPLEGERSILALSLLLDLTERSNLRHQQHSCFAGLALCSGSLVARFSRLLVVVGGGGGERPLQQLRTRLLAPWLFGLHVWVASCCAQGWTVGTMPKGEEGRLHHGNLGTPCSKRSGLHWSFSS